jgi:hypothetical protein
MLDRALQIFAIGQTIVASIRAGSRAWHVLRKGPIGVMNGPLILPPPVNETSNLFDLTLAFRHAVQVCDAPQTDREASAMLGREKKCARIDREKQSGFSQPSDPLAQNINRDHRMDNEEIDRLLDELESSEKEPKVSWKSFFEACRQTAVVPVQRASLFGASLPVSAWFATKRFWNLDAASAWSTIEILDGPSGFTDYVSAELVFEKGDKSAYPRVALIKAYAPEEFTNLRSNFGISESDYARSILHSGPFVSFQSNSKGAARVGGVFFFTRDGNYMIKTIKAAEVHALLQMMPKYYNFMKRNGRRSLLTRICGLYDIDIQDASSGVNEKYTIVVTNSVFPAESSSIISERFDLKGSTLGRECSPEERRTKGSNAILKDLDLSREVQLVKSFQDEGTPHFEGYGLHIGPAAKAALLTQLRKDVHLLVLCNVIDYSLLVGVSRLDSRHFTVDELHLIDSSTEAELRLSLARRGQAADAILSALIMPVRLLTAPPIYLYRRAWSLFRRTVSWPLPYYGSGECGIDAGGLARVQGDRLGHPSVFYLGVIDFLQPFNIPKRAEWKYKSWKYGEGFSCVPPEQYAERFLAFLESHIS